MGIFGESKQEIIGKYEKIIRELKNIIDNQKEEIKNLEVKQIEIKQISDENLRLNQENKEIESENSRLNQKNKEIKFENSQLILKNNNLESNVAELKAKNVELENLKSLSSETWDEIKKGNIISRGVYKSGEDFSPGKYDFFVIRGEGTLSCTKGDILEFMSKNPHDSYIEKYRNMNIPNGSKIEVTQDLQLLMYYSRPIEPAQKEDRDQSIMTAGQYKIGDDVPFGSFIYEVKRGKGYLDDNDEICEDLKQGDKGRIHLKKGKTLIIEKDLEIILYYSTPISIKEQDKENNDILYTGKYDAGLDIPYGYYNFEVLSGDGNVEVKSKDGNIKLYEYFSKSTNDGIQRYHNIQIGVGDTVELDNDLKIKISFLRSYINKEISDKILCEIRDVRDELETLNNEVINKYYSFSDYNNITSEDCKNKFLILKSKEKDLRESNQDIRILDTPDKKVLPERSIRQILRNFNADCDNQIMNISIKNIDVVRNRIQKSYDTLNKLYSVDGIALSDKLLSLKLEQATLLYTYELKYQQEKDIQQAIKEQMIEEAKAEREIQEQKKKIEKDLQQHLGEVNRLMKYMQKAQIDAERQLYIDKIKELEDKIKSLEADKETVLEREANAKAGFVYIISNIGSFGEDIYKIGMTRRLDPMDRINELSSASVPFEFDVHAMIFSSDAPELETMLHRHFADSAVNKVNPRKEFYKVDIDEIERIVKDNYNDTVQFTKIPVAAEYRQSIELERSTEYEQRS